MNLTYYGHSCFAVEAAGKTLLFDPFITPNELAKAIDVDAVPLLPGCLDLVERNTPGGGRTNQAHFSSGIEILRQNSDSRKIQLMFDPQTSGGLLVAVAPDVAADAIAALAGVGVSTQLIGEVLAARGSGANLAVILR